ncbi:Transcriptional repressor IclR [Paraburkholderia aspalathi]|uniref:IclR family transcriptional regulator n=1 Tax=Paraburkholderia aspalathi TaxID=1324617 RepID=UPI00190A3A79|nr:helix-turn-helix domain-containing protein [Paraburkholderia aspalathi]MBK3843362.1 helix-turn-helix domain-containing protein [Paraburkholderia aspalathi]CAE6850814.1 Transcriptional repressor IclR [Paraburkholderia aspalathi]
MSNDGASTAEKALSLLDCFSPGNERHTLATLTKVSGIHRTTVYRLMNSLERMNYVVRSQVGEYSLGPRVLYLGKLYEQSFHLASIVEPVLRSISAESGESASYNVIENGERLCLFREEQTVGLRETRLPGTSLPLDNTCGSLVMRYWGFGEQLFEAPPQLPLFTSRERDEYTAAFSVPVFGEGNLFKASLTLSGPVARIEAARAENRFDAMLLNAASTLSRNLGASSLFCQSVFGRKTAD